MHAQTQIAHIFRVPNMGIQVEMFKKRVEEIGDENHVKTSHPHHRWFLITWDN